LTGGSVASEVNGMGVVLSMGMGVSVGGGSVDAIPGVGVPGMGITFKGVILGEGVILGGIVSDAVALG